MDASKCCHLCSSRCSFLSCSLAALHSEMHHSEHRFRRRTSWARAQVSWLEPFATGSSSMKASLLVWVGDHIKHRPTSVLHVSLSILRLSSIRPLKCLGRHTCSSSRRRYRCGMPLFSHPQQSCRNPYLKLVTQGSCANTYHINWASAHLQGY